MPRLSWITRTTGALSLRSGYTIQVFTLSVGPIFTIIHSPWRGDPATRAAAVAFDAGRFAACCADGAASLVAGIDTSCVS
jgi:hypothetical protein